VIRELGVAGPVLDVACGSGYGSYGIARRFPEMEVLGGDYDKEAIAFARKKYIAPNLSFSEADVTRWQESLGNRKFGCIISFDTIEHIEHREVMMQNIVEHLLPDGILLLSTPVRAENVLNPRWEHHKIEFSRALLYDFLRRYFGRVLVPDYRTLPCEEVFESINRDEVFYLLKMNPVVCSEPILIRMGK
jgi:SAM-dependent methyltransferase